MTDETHPMARRRTPRPLISHTSLDPAGLLSLIVDQPHWPDAACRGLHEVFDDAIKDERAQTTARKICGRCPNVDECRLWLASLPKSDRPPGVCAGVVTTLVPKGNATTRIAARLPRTGTNCTGGARSTQRAPLKA